MFGIFIQFHDGTYILLRKGTYMECEYILDCVESAGGRTDVMRVLPIGEANAMRTSERVVA